MLTANYQRLKNLNQVFSNISKIHQQNDKNIRRVKSVDKEIIVNVPLDQEKKKCHIYCFPKCQL